MTNELSMERAIEALYTVRAYYASLTAGYPKGKDRRGIGDVMCSEIANSCLMAIKALEQQPSDDCISRAKALEMLGDEPENWTDTEKEIQEVNDYRWFKSILEELPPVTPKADVLDKIKAEIDQKQYDFMEDKDYDEGIRFGLMLAYQIIDKYKTESEE